MDGGTTARRKHQSQAGEAADTHLVGPGFLKLDHVFEPPGDLVTVQSLGWYGRAGTWGSAFSRKSLGSADAAGPGHIM